jgi:hypothetical protein
MRFQVLLNDELKFDGEVSGLGILSCEVILDSVNAQGEPDPIGIPIDRHLAVFGGRFDESQRVPHTTWPLKVGDVVVVRLLEPSGRNSGCRLDSIEFEDPPETEDDSAEAATARLHVACDNEHWCTAGIRDRGLVHVMVTWFLRYKSEGTRGECSETEELATVDVGGVDSRKEHFVNWGSEAAIPGFEYTIRIDGPGEIDSPVWEWSYKGE